MEKITINEIEIDPQYYIDKWTNWALEATTATDEQVTKNIQWLYKKAGLKKPQVEVYRDYKKFIERDWDSVLASVGDSVRASVGVSVVDSVGDSVRASVGVSVVDSVRASVGASVRVSVVDSVRASVGASVRVSVRDSVWDSVWDSVGDSVRVSVRDSVWDSVRASVGAWYWADDLSFADVFIDTKILSKEKSKELQKYKEVLETQRLAVFTDTIAYVLVAPTIRRENGQLHSDQRPAVEWENETGQYYLDGVNLSKELWQKIISNTMSFSEIMAIKISDHRTVALKYNPEAIIKENAELIHADNRNNELYKIEGQQINKDLEFPKIWFLKMKCPTGRYFVEGVPPEEAEKNPNATSMQALLCGLTQQQYLDMVFES